MDHKTLKPNELKALRYIRNEIVHKGHSPSVRDVQGILGYESPRTALIAIDGLIDKKYLKRKLDKTLQLLSDLPDEMNYGRTVNVPLVGYVSCGLPMLAEENIEAMVPVSDKLAKPGSRYFLLRAMGDSMNKAGICNRDLVLVRQQPTADDGQKVVALIDDEAIIKEFHRTPEAVVLRPKSTNKKYQPIILNNDFVIQGVVVATLPASAY
jgi:repressor LexA